MVAKKSLLVAQYADDAAYSDTQPALRSMEQHLEKKKSRLPVERWRRRNVPE
jgi:hypothetical protein